MTKTKTERLTDLAPNGYCEFATRDVENRGEIHTVRGWWWRQTPTGEPRGPSYPAKYIGRNFEEAEEFFTLGAPR